MMSRAASLQSTQPEALDLVILVRHVFPAEYRAGRVS